MEYKLEICEIKSHPNGLGTLEDRTAMQFQGDEELLARIEHAITSEIIKYYDKKKETK